MNTLNYTRFYLLPSAVNSRVGFWCPVCRTYNMASSAPWLMEQEVELHELEAHGLMPHWGKDWGYPEPTTGGAHYRERKAP